MAEELGNSFRRLIGGVLQSQTPIRPDIPQPKEIIGPERTLILQITPDGSTGADVVSVVKNKVIVVDGVGMSADGDRLGAERLASTLKNTDGPLQSNGAYITLAADADSLVLMANAGCFGITYESDPQTGLLKPNVIYAGNDLRPQEIYQRRDIKDTKFALMLTDGGVDLFASLDLFGDRPEFSRSARKVVDRIKYDKISADEIPGAFENILLRPLTAIINENPNHATLQDALNKRFKDFSAEMARFSKPPFTDDATLVFVQVSL